MMDLDTLKARNLGAAAKAGFSPAPKPETLNTWSATPKAAAAWVQRAVAAGRAAAAE